METLSVMLRAIDAERPIVLGISRRGVLLADSLARAIGAPLDVVPAHKVIVHDGKGLAIGAVAAGGVRIVHTDAIEELGLADDDVEALFDRAAGALDAELAATRGDWPMPDLTGRTAFLVDDGAVTGLTMIAAAASVRDRAAGELIAVLPWCGIDALAPISRSVHRILSVKRVTSAEAEALHLRALREGPNPPELAEIHELLTRRLYDLGVENLAVDGP